MMYIRLTTSIFLFSRAFKVAAAAALSPDVIAVTQPLHRSIDSLKEKLEAMEARHETLEAATEQFRLKVKSLKEKLSEEEARYDWLMRTKTEQEEQHDEKSAMLRNRIEETEKEISSMKTLYEAMLTDERMKHSDYESRLAMKDEHIVLQGEQMKILSYETATLQASLSAQTVEMLMIKSENVQLRDELLQTRHEIQELEAKVEKARWRTSWKDIAESEVVSAIVDIIYEYWEWLKDDIVPHSIERLLVLFNSIRYNALKLRVEAIEYMRIWHLALIEYFKETPDRSRNAILQDIFCFFLGVMDDVWLRASSLSARIWEENIFPKLSPHLSKTPILFVIGVFSRLAEVHNALASTLEWLAVAFSTYHMTSLEGSHPHRLYITCMYVKDHSHRIVLLLEIALGLLALDISLTSLRRSRKRIQSGRRISKARQHTILTPKGPVPTASLLRSAGGLSLRHP